MIVIYTAIIFYITNTNIVVVCFTNSHIIVVCCTNSHITVVCFTKYTYNDFILNY